MLRIAGGLLLNGAGCVFLIVAISLFRRSWRLKSNGISVFGRVVGYHTADRESSPLLEVAFLDEGGVEHQVRLLPDRRRCPAIGETISLFYDSVDPRVVSGTTSDQLWYFPILFAGLSAVLFVLGVGAMGDY